MNVRFRMFKREATLLIVSALAFSGCSPAFKGGSLIGTGFSASALRQVNSQVLQGSSKPLIYVADNAGPGHPCCHIAQELEFAVDATGNVMPARQIAGAATKLFNPAYQAMDAAGYLYVVNILIPGGKPRPNVVVFAPGASGNSAPVRTLTMDQGASPYPFQIAIDAQGYLYEADQGAARIDVYAPGAQGRVKPVRIISGPRTGLTTPFGIALDNAANI